MAGYKQKFMGRVKLPDLLSTVRYRPTAPHMNIRYSILAEYYPSNLDSCLLTDILTYL
jgi:hypothetical protein